MSPPPPDQVDVAVNINLKGERDNIEDFILTTSVPSDKEENSISTSIIGGDLASDLYSISKNSNKSFTFTVKREKITKENSKIYKVQLILVDDVSTESKTYPIKLNIEYIVEEAKQQGP